MTRVQSIQAVSIPAAKGHYSHAVKGGGMLFISGQLPMPADGSAPAKDFAGQARTALANVLAIAQAGGCSAADLAKVTVYLVGIENWPLFDTIYAEMMGDARPARAVVPVPELHYGFLVEIEAVGITG